MGAVRLAHGVSPNAQEWRMVGVSWLGAIVIGLLAGWLAERIMARSHGLITNLIVGLIGAMLGAWAAEFAGFSYSGFLPSLVVSTVGAVLLLFLLGLLRRRG
jgi:uncharacterized membrane protein YeaQ/YmgE (transglycosylase-associated protein family)